MSFDQQPISPDEMARFERWVRGVFEWPLELADHWIYHENELIADLPEDGPVVLDFVDYFLQHPERLRPYSKDKIAQGFGVFFDPSGANHVHAYRNDKVPVERRAAAVSNLRLLYVNYFDRLCLEVIREIGRSHDADSWRMEDRCFMFWDCFVISPFDQEERIIQAGLAVMREALDSGNQSCIASALHGLGHWCHCVPEIKDMIGEWLALRTDLPDFIIDYAHDAMDAHVQ